MLRRELERIEHAQHLVEVAPRAHRIGKRQLDLLVGPDDEHGAHGLVVRGGCGPPRGTRHARRSPLPVTPADQPSNYFEMANEPPIPYVTFAPLMNTCLALGMIVEPASWGSRANPPPSIARLPCCSLMPLAE